MMAMIALAWAFLALPVSLGLAICAMGQIARRDVQRFEIDFGACALLVTAGLLAAAITDGTRAIADGLISGTITGGVTALAHLRWPGRLGRGDIVLLASMGAVAGTTRVPLLMGIVTTQHVFRHFLVTTQHGYPLDSLHVIRERRIVNKRCFYANRSTAIN